VFEEDDGGDRTPHPAVAPQPEGAILGVADVATTPIDPYSALLERLSRPALTAAEEEDQRDAAERLHALGTDEALKRLDSTPNSALARAILRDTRWDTPQAGPVPILGTPGAAAAAWHLVRIRLARAADLAAARWTSASAGGATAGAIGGVIGGLMLVTVPGNRAPFASVPVLAAIGTICGGLAGAGVGAGMAMAESVLRSWRTPGTIAGGAVGGGLVGLAIELMSTWTLEVLVGITPPIGGGVDGFLIGGAVATGYALATRGATGGAPAPRGSNRLRVALITACSCALVALAISLAGRPLVGGTVHLIARAAGGQGLLGPLGRLIGEPDFGPITAAFIAFGEGLTFGFGVAFGLTRRR
jgi:hypothetical protein